MAYTVNKLAKISGVTVRTLHFYDEIGLLKPAYHGPNGYRFYEEEQLLMLQQILFYRELGFELKKIQQMLGRAKFDKLAALASHRKVLLQELKRTHQLIKTIDKTIEHLRGTKSMKDQELYRGFDAKKQAEHEQYLINRYGEGMKKGIAATRRKMKNWTKADWERNGAEFTAICRDLTALMERHVAADSTETQRIVGRHFQWLKNFWTPNRESYIGHSQLIADSDLRQAYDVHHPRLADFLAKGIKVYAERELA